MSSYFEILGVPPRFELDAALLERRYRDLSRALHPDRAGSASAGEAVDLNVAYHALRDELTRGRALLDALGSRVEGSAREEDPEFLVTIMELREALSDARDRGDEAGIEALAARVKETYRGVRAELIGALDAGDHMAAERHLARMRYYRRFLDEVDAIEDANLAG